MICVGDFAVVKDRWRNLAVDYYLEHAYEPYAKMIFGHTPEMMDFYSKLLGYDFPWEKYAQVVVRDYVSGAMENTTAVVHIDWMQQTPREYLDGNYEDYISHELTHHWFGDLVTCESWSNLVLNEGFANYGEYLWREYKYGRDDADYHNLKKQNLYLYTAAGKDADVVRYHYTDREDMYDPISYDKGGRILHMLRRVVGDEAFFASLKLYIRSHLYAPVEIHDLRMAFEKVTGEDLNWFFSEWYLNRGYPRLVIRYEYSDTLKKQTVTIDQMQDFTKNPLFRMPLAIDIYMGGKAERHQVVLEKASQVFEFQAAVRPDLVNVDAEKMLLCTKKDYKPRSQYVYQYYHAPLYLDRYEAVSSIGDGVKSGSEESKMILDAMKDPFWNIRLTAIRNCEDLAKDKETGLKEALLRLLSDSKSHVRLAAMKVLVNNYYDEQTDSLLVAALKDSSYLVIQNAFSLLAGKNEGRARAMAPTLEKEESEKLMEELAGYYTRVARPENNDFFRNSVQNKKPGEQERILEHYGNYLSMQNYKMREEGIVFLDSLSRKAQPWYVRLASVNSLTDLHEELGKRISSPSNDKQILTPTDVEQMRKEMQAMESQIADIKKMETNKKLLEYYKK
jgi:aminopeptidase N